MASAHPLTFAALLRHHRRRAGLSQEELAERSGLSRRGVSDLERDIGRVPRKDTVALLAAALQLSPEEHAQWEAAARVRLLDLPPLAPPPSALASDRADSEPERAPRLTSVARPAGSAEQATASGAQDTTWMLSVQARRLAENPLPIPPTPLIGREH